MEHSTSIKNEQKTAVNPLNGFIGRKKVSLTDEEIIKDLLPQKFGMRGMVWVGILVIICLVGVYSYYRQLRYGLIVTSMRDYASWGIYISNFVFFVAISLVGDDRICHGAS